MKRAIYGVLALVNLALVAWAIGRMPEMVPVHFNYAGEADRFAGRWWYLAAGVVPVVIMLAYMLYVRLTRGNARIQKNRALEDMLVPSIALMMAAVGWVVILITPTGERISPNYFSLIFVIMGIMMVFISNFMGKVSPNRYLGYKLPWTLKDDEVWNKTHRLAGYTGVVGGAIMTAGGLAGFGGLLAASFILFFGGLLAATLPPTLYAWRLYRRLHPNG